MEFLPIGVLATGAVVLLSLTGSRRQRDRFVTFGALLTAVCAMAAAAALIGAGGGFQDPLLAPFFVRDVVGVGAGVVILLLLALVTPVVVFDVGPLRAASSGVFSLLLLSTAGALVMAFSRNLLFFVVGLELLSLPLYVLVGMGRSEEACEEAAFKYFLLGAASSAVMIYGMAILWGAFGTLDILEWGRLWEKRGEAGPDSGLAILGATLTMSGLAFKIGWVPFHMWLPDVYEGAPSGVVAWMSGAVKAATFAFAYRFTHALHGLFPTVVGETVMVVAAASMIWGSLAAVYQSNFKRMLAYSSIAHAGYAALALLPSSARFGGERALVLYLFTYALASFGAFVIASLQEAEGKTRVADLSGLAERRPMIGLILAVALLSLAGIPPLGGFVAKFYVFLAAVRGGHFLLVLLGVLTSVVSLAYYLKVLVAVYMQEPKEVRPVYVGIGRMIVLGGGALATLLIGIWPAGVLDFLADVSQKLWP